jgi:hypothetical protein
MLNKFLAFGFRGWRWFSKPVNFIDSDIHYWKAFRFQGGGTLISPVPMNEVDALKWVSAFGSVAFVDRECGFIFYRPKE